MEDNVSEMMSGRPDAVELAIQHVRENCQWMPICCNRMCKRPFYPLNAYATRNLWVPVDVRAIVEVDEPVSESLSENDPNEGDEPNADPDDLQGEARAIAHG